MALVTPEWRGASILLKVNDEDREIGKEVKGRFVWRDSDHRSWIPGLDVARLAADTESEAVVWS